MKKIIGVVLVGVCVLLVGCGQSEQEKVAEQQKAKLAIILNGLDEMPKLVPLTPHPKSGPDPYKMLHQTIMDVHVHAQPPPLKKAIPNEKNQ